MGEQAGYPYLALELVEGTNLARWLGRTPRSSGEAAHITATLAKAVEYAHQQGVIHRDLKPANILLRMDVRPDRQLDKSACWDPGSGVAKITDFGLAKLLATSEGADDQMTQTGAIMGTPEYVAPEQARGDMAKVGPTADVYSLGVVLYELLTGRPPFQGSTPMETLVQAAHQEPVVAVRLVPNVARDLQTVCLKCLEKSPQNRYQTAGELAADIERFLKDEPIHARPAGWIENSLKWVRRHKGAAAAITGIALLLVVTTVGALAAATYFRARTEPAETDFGKGRGEKGSSRC